MAPTATRKQREIQERETLIAVTEAKTEQAVFVELDDAGAHVVGFTREDRHEYEWANLVGAPPGTFRAESKAVFERLTEHLPVPAQTIVSYEVDTDGDLEGAEAYAKTISGPS